MTVARLRKIRSEVHNQPTLHRSVEKVTVVPEVTMMNVSAPLMRIMEKQRRYRSTGGHRTRGLMRSRRSRRALDAILVALRLPPPSPPLHQTVTMARQPRRGCAARNLAATKQRRQRRTGTISVAGRHPDARAVAMSPPAPPLNQTPLNQKAKGTPRSPHFPKKNPSASKPCF